MSHSEVQLTGNLQQFWCRRVRQIENLPVDQYVFIELDSGDTGEMDIRIYTARGTLNGEVPIYYNFVTIEDFLAYLES